MKTPKMRQSITSQPLRPRKPEHNKQPTVTLVKPSPPTVGGTQGPAGAITTGRVTGGY
jgi:hypothetical protein